MSTWRWLVLFVVAFCVGWLFVELCPGLLCEWMPP